MLKIEGVYPALITPFTKDDEVDAAGLKRMVEYVEEGGVAGIPVARQGSLQRFHTMSISVL